MNKFQTIESLHLGIEFWKKYLYHLKNSYAYEITHFLFTFIKIILSTLLRLL